MGLTGLKCLRLYIHEKHQHQICDLLVLFVLDLCSTSIQSIQASQKDSTRRNINKGTLNVMLRLFD